MSGRRSRDRGNGYERDIVKEINEMGYEVVTSRSESKRMDDRKVDVFSPMGTDPEKVFPFYVQNKFTANNPSYHSLLEEMPQDRPGLVFHKKSVAKKDKNGKTRHYAAGEYVTMKKEVFYELLNHLRMANLKEAKELFDYVLSLPEEDRKKEITDLEKVLEDSVMNLPHDEASELMEFVLDMALQNPHLSKIFVKAYEKTVSDE